MKYKTGVPEVRDTPGAGDPQGPRRFLLPAYEAADLPRVNRPLRPRQLATLQCIALGLTEQAAARKLGCATCTVRRRLAAARETLGARSTAHAVALAVAAGLIEVDQVEG